MEKVKMKIKIVSAGNDNVKYIYDVTNKNKSLYCSSHEGIEFKFVNLGGSEISSKDCKTMKQKVILDELNNKDSDYVIWMDTDTYFNNFNKTFNEIIEKYPDKSLIVARDGGPLAYSPKEYLRTYSNSGVLVFKNDEISREIISKWTKIPTEGQRCLNHIAQFLVD